MIRVPLVLVLVAAGTGCAPSGCVITTNSLTPTPPPVLMPANPGYQGKRGGNELPMPLIPANPADTRC